MKINVIRYDEEAHYASKTTEELQQEKRFFEEATAKEPTPEAFVAIIGMYKEHIEWLRSKIAERMLSKE